MYLSNPILHTNSTMGQNIEVLDPRMVKQNFDNIQGEHITTENCLQDVQARLVNIEKLISFCHENFPEILVVFAAAEAAKVRVGAKQPIPTTQDELERQLQMAGYVKEQINKLIRK